LILAILSGAETGGVLAGIFLAIPVALAVAVGGLPTVEEFAAGSGPQPSAVFSRFHVTASPRASESELRLGGPARKFEMIRELRDGIAPMIAGEIASGLMFVGGLIGLQGPAPGERP
jgi:hypothetical protein